MTISTFMAIFGPDIMADKPMDHWIGSFCNPIRNRFVSNWRKGAETGRLHTLGIR